MSVYSPAGVHVTGIASNLAARARHTDAVLLDRWLPRAAALWPERLAVSTPEEEISYAELWRRAAAAAAALDPGARIALDLPPGVEFAVALHACLVSGAVAVPIDQRATGAERAALLARTTPY